MAWAAHVVCLYGAACRYPVNGTCEFYRNCLQPRVACLASEYPLGYGEVYCHTFLEVRKQMSDAGQLWADGVRNCLQHRLAQQLHAGGFHDCHDLERFAIGTHSECYGHPDHSVCLFDTLLTWRDIWTVGKTIWREWFTVQFYTGVADLYSICARRKDEAASRLLHVDG